MKRIISIILIAFSVFGCKDKGVQNKIQPYEYYRTFSRNGSIVFIDIRTGERLSEKYLDAKPFKEGFALVKTSEGWTFINQNFERINEDYYLDATQFSEGIALTVKNGEHIKAIGTDGKVIFELTDADKAEPFKFGHSIITLTDGGSALIDKSGKNVFETKYLITDYNEDYIIVADPRIANGDILNPYGVINYNHMTILPLGYSDIDFCKDGFIVGKTEKGNETCYGLTGYDGRELIDINYNSLKEYGDEYVFSIADQAGMLCGIMDTEQNIIHHGRLTDMIPCGDSGKAIAYTYEDGESEYDVKCGVINKKGEWVIEPKFAEISSHNGKEFIVKPESSTYGYGIIKSDGEIIIQSEALTIEHLLGDYYIVETDTGLYIADISKADDNMMDINSFDPIEEEYSSYLSDYHYDLDSIVETLFNTIDSVRPTTLSSIMADKPDIKKSSFSKGVAKDIMMQEDNHKAFYTVTYAKHVLPWLETYDFWEGVVMEFNPDYLIKTWAVETHLTRIPQEMMSELQNRIDNRLYEIEYNDGKHYRYIYHEGNTYYISFVADEDYVESDD